MTEDHVQSGLSSNNPSFKKSNHDGGYELLF